MGKVQLAPLWSVAAGMAGLLAVSAVAHLSPPGWIAGAAYLLASNALLARGLRRGGSPHFGWANAATATRSTLVGLVTALVVTSFGSPVPVPLLIALTVPALALDAVDGWIARRTHTTSALGARFDMEVDAWLILVLSAYVAQELGWWVLTIGAMRYSLLVAERLLPWLANPVPPRFWRKVVAAYTGIALAVTASELFPEWVGLIATLVSLALLLESFGRDVLWLAREHRGAGAQRFVRASSSSG
ncbi:CDP-alcohol phosphatidyltransferase family protein [Microbacterium sp. SS28]|uniref:CDP-alcohol phosphatidyltransferase family protein n=1 Tax=Microbacterium sp. SS28 TaxID=2919948 RepID=UPI001FAABB22|nr:CDP-alcohol phosphatidyltransferase family protein [Microbacterium sp. SS28]